MSFPYAAGSGVLYQGLGRAPLLLALGPSPLHAHGAVFLFERPAAAHFLVQACSDKVPSLVMACSDKVPFLVQACSDDVPLSVQAPWSVSADEATEPKLHGEFPAITFRAGSHCCSGFAGAWLALWLPKVVAFGPGGPTWWSDPPPP